jgi:surface polysaccharide O-acyltransferase-like enzyme
MEQTKKELWRQLGIVGLCHILGVAVMIGIFALLGHFDYTVALGGLVGGLVSFLNFFFMVIGLSAAADRAQNQDANGGKGLVKGSYFIRIAVMFLVLFACAKSGHCNVIALVVPLLFVRPALMVAEFFGKKGE